MADTKYNLFQVIVDFTSRKLLASSNSLSPRTNPITFVNKDTIEGNARLYYQTGLNNPPLIRVALPTVDVGVKIAVTDGASVLYCNAQNISLQGTGDIGDPRIVWTFDFDTVPLDNALAATTDQFINAVLEMRLRVTAVDGAIIQDADIVREACQIYKTFNT